MSERRPLLALSIFVLSFSLYLATASGHAVSVDGTYYFRVAQRIVQDRTLAIEMVGTSDVGRYAIIGPDGKIYSKYAPLQSIVEAPFYAIGQVVVTTFLGGDQDLESRLIVPVPLLTNVVLSSAMLCLTFLTVVRLGYPESTGLLVALLLGSATLVWPNARGDGSEPLQALLLLAAFAVAREVRPSSRLSTSLLAGLILGLLVLAKAPNILLLPIFGVGLLWRLRGARRATLIAHWLAFGLSAAAGVAAFLLYNHLRSGSYLDFGYREPFDTPVLVGLYGWLLSPGKGVFLYMPVLILAALAFPLFARRHAFEAALIAAASGVLVVSYAIFWDWSGDWAWGVRFAVPLLALWILPLAAGMARYGGKWRVALAFAASVSILFQTLGVAVDPVRFLQYYHFQVAPLIGELPPTKWPENSWSKESLSPVHFAPELSPLLGHWLIFRAAVDPGLSAEVPDQPPERLADPPPLARAIGARYWLPTPPRDVVGLDLWVLRAPAGTATTAALIGLGALFASGLAAMWLGLRRNTAGPPACRDDYPVVAR